MVIRSWCSVWTSNPGTLNGVGVRFALRSVFINYLTYKIDKYFSPTLSMILIGSTSFSTISFSMRNWWTPRYDLSFVPKSIALNFLNFIPSAYSLHFWSSNYFLINGALTFLSWSSRESSSSNGNNNSALGDNLKESLGFLV